MRIVYLRKKHNSYPGHAEGGILIFDDQDIRTRYLFKCDYRDIKKISVTDVISNLSDFGTMPSLKNFSIYSYKVTTYKDFLAILDLIITAEYTSETNPELFI